MAAIMSDVLGLEICEALDIDPGTVNGITIEIVAGRSLCVHIKTIGERGKLDSINWREQLKDAEIKIG